MEANVLFAVQPLFYKAKISNITTFKGLFSFSPCFFSSTVPHCITKTVVQGSIPLLVC